jgi:(R)-2-hydroxyacyl-CoA dehydratese activating ATPase
MIVAGVDVGAATAKTAILIDRKFVSSAIMPTGDIVSKAAEEITIEALNKAGLKMSDLDYVVSTGYGRHMVKFTDKAVSEIICHAKGVNYLLPGARTIIDIGGQDSKVIGVRENGTVSDFVMNDKCAAGTGRFLEVMATVLKADISEMGPLSLTSKAPSSITSTCTIFAESEIVSLRAEDAKREDMIAGLHRAVSKRVVIMGKTVGYKDDVVFTGGVAKNSGVLKFLEELLEMKIVLPDEPQIMGALGAALFANIDIGFNHADGKQTREAS